MRIALFGATGPSGQCVVKEAISRHHDVVALVRNVQKFEEFVSTLTVPDGVSVTAKQVDIFDADSITPHLKEGIDAVMSTLGATAFKEFMSCSLYSKSIVPMVKSMGETGVNRLIVMSTWCSAYEADNPKWVEFLFKPLVIGSICKDLNRAENYLENLPVSAGIQYTIVRAPGLQNAPMKTDLEMQEKENAQWVPDCASGMPRANVAKFMIDCLDRPETARKVFAIGLKK